MPHEIDRILRMAGQGTWFIHPAKAEQIVAALALRAQAGPRDDAAFPGTTPVALNGEARGDQRLVRVLRLHGSILPRANMMTDFSGGVAMERFQAAFRAAADDQACSAIVIDIDSPGGQVGLVPETAAMIRAAKRSDRPIIAVANTLAASAAYWIASACDEIVVTPSGEVGSIGVYCIHQEISEKLAMEGIAVTMISSGPRKTEGNPFAPLDEPARAAIAADGAAFYDMFTKDVAKARGVPVSVVRADPETAERHMGGGRCYGAQMAVKLGMADRVATLDETLQRLVKGGRSGARRASIERRRLSLI
ncbi:S49 family peptidase [Oceaniglobus trochenteri]|uniref:S49 family peptidase n=1 Tax=Oceaniglobus trochenteri TaxID=2763260 RepID=UPI001CFF5E92|nr:S49 family peptidase [Oceaniglobus trochenteri]